MSSMQDFALGVPSVCSLYLLKSPIQTYFRNTASKSFQRLFKIRSSETAPALVVQQWRSPYPRGRPGFNFWPKQAFLPFMLQVYA